ncbi:hypothetical protein D9611_011173 [Ephemerocybe angulata]|uniref:Fungal-type protein kinase domain-containing protein n=1 Tax=Ephemerocybe angulata TaxID=980116 RepID=A0A8H5CCA5_9AGAR|nr:hypothetical protein D9611_011173 [Tulosesus angulatus]
MSTPTDSNPPRYRTRSITRSNSSFAPVESIGPPVQPKPKPRSRKKSAVATGERPRTRSQGEATPAAAAAAPQPAAPKPRNPRQYTARFELARKAGELRNQTPPRTTAAVVESEPAPHLSTPQTYSTSEAAAIFSGTQSGGTPQGASTQNAMFAHQKVAELKEDLKLELGTDIYVTDRTWAPSLYHDLVSEGDVDKFLKQSNSGYREGRWTGLPEYAKKESDLYKPIVAIVNRILAKFGRDGAASVTRKAVDTHALNMDHDNHHKTRPDISIRATGPSFARPSTSYSTGIGYQNVASVFDAKLERAKDQQLDQVAQLGTYCRQIYIQQPNREFVRALIITEKHVRVVHYDRSGTYVTPFHDVHTDPLTFIRLVLGLSSTDESVLGIDTSVQWIIDPKTGKKCSGTIASSDREGNPINYNLDMTAPPFVRASIRGRGTTCWHASHPETGERVLIKDAWRTGTRKSEIEYLKVAQGVEGVVQMISFEDDRAETKNYRPATCQHPGFHNRIKSRVVMEHYGPSIWNFDDRIQLIAAIKDAIQAHKKLYDRLVLHRDISMQNVLIGPSAEPGRRGVIIDLDMAVKIDRKPSEISADPRTGTRQYQSMAVLQSSNPKIQPPPPQDHLDDIESFFYATCHIVFWFATPGVPNRNIPEFLSKWESAKEADARAWKALFMSEPLDTDLISKYWGRPIVNLLQSFKKFIDGIHRSKADYRATAKTSDKLVKMLRKKLWMKAEEHYAEVDGFFQTCLDALELEEINGPAPGTSDSSAPSSPESSPIRLPQRRQPLPQLASGHYEPTEGVKRPSEEALTEGSPKKRQRSGLSRRLEAENATLERSSSEDSE